MLNANQAQGTAATQPGRLVELLGNNGCVRAPFPPGGRPVLGVIRGTGIGAEVIPAALQVLDAVTQVCGVKFEVLHGGPVGEEAEARFNDPLPETTAQFFLDVFARSGAVLSGPGGGRYVYDLRRRFDLFCKFAPVRPWPELACAARSYAAQADPVDMLIVRDNAAGIYQGRWEMRAGPDGRLAEHSFSYSEGQVKRLAEIAARAAAKRRGRLHIIGKDAGVPSITTLWRDVGATSGRQHGVEVAFMNVDLAAYELIRNPARFDVVLTPNLFGDILVDITGALLGSRGVTFSGNFDAAGNGVYQTNHGCAHDLAGKDCANPAGQILALAMLLRESFGLSHAAALVEQAVAAAWRKGCRTADLVEDGCRLLGTKAMADEITRQVHELASTAKAQ